MAMKLGKLALLRPSGSRHPEPEVAALEKELEELTNASGVGPTGLGGKTRVLAVHVEYGHRHPAPLGDRDPVLGPSPGHCSHRSRRLHHS